MRRLWISIGTALLFPLLAAAGAAEPTVVLHLSTANCFPGDVVEIRASTTGTELTELELKLPKHDALHSVSHQRGPVRYREGVYSQEDTWIVQPTRAGKIELEGIKATLHQGGSTSEIALTAPVLTVKGYPATEDSFVPEPLPAATAPSSEASGFLSIYIGVAVLAAAVLLVIAFKRKPKANEPGTEREPSLEDLRAALDAGDTPVATIERVLSAEPAMSAELRAALERAAYDRAFNRDALRNLLRREGAR